VCVCVCIANMQQSDSRPTNHATEAEIQKIGSLRAVWREELAKLHRKYPAAAAGPSRNFPVAIIRADGDSPEASYDAFYAARAFAGAVLFSARKDASFELSNASQVEDVDDNVCTYAGADVPVVSLSDKACTSPDEVVQKQISDMFLAEATDAMRFFITQAYLIDYSRGKRYKTYLSDDMPPHMLFQLLPDIVYDQLMIMNVDEECELGYFTMSPKNKFAAAGFDDLKLSVAAITEDFCRRCQCMDIGDETISSDPAILERFFEKFSADAAQSYTFHNKILLPTIPVGPVFPESTPTSAEVMPRWVAYTLDPLTAGHMQHDYTQVVSDRTPSPLHTHQIPQLLPVHNRQLQENVSTTTAVVANSADVELSRTTETRTVDKSIDVNRGSWSLEDVD